MSDPRRRLGPHLQHPSSLIGEDDDDEGVQKLRTLMEQDQEPTRGCRLRAGWRV